MFEAVAADFGLWDLVWAQGFDGVDVHPSYDIQFEI
jgi:hypothetical protein